MAREQPLFASGEYVFDFDATDMAYQYTAVKLANSTTQHGTGMGKVALVPCAAGEDAHGILQMNGAKGEAANVMQLGVSFAKISASAAAGKVNDYLASGPNGALVKANSGDYAIAKAREDYQPGDITTAMVFPFGKQ